MSRPKYVASCSGGKDSVATLLLAAQHKEPLDEAVFSEVMFDRTQAAKSRNTGTLSMTGSSPSVKKGSWASSSPFSMQTRPTMTCSIMSSPVDRIRARFAASHGLVCVQSIGTAKSRPSASTMPRFLRTP